MPGNTSISAQHNVPEVHRGNAPDWRVRAAI